MQTVGQKQDERRDSIRNAFCLGAVHVHAAVLGLELHCCSHDGRNWQLSETGETCMRGRIGVTWNASQTNAVMRDFTSCQSWIIEIHTFYFWQEFANCIEYCMENLQSCEDNH